MSGAASLPTLAEIARARGLPYTADLLARPEAARRFDDSRVPMDPRRVEPPHAQPKSVLGQMARRGLDPALVRALWPWFSERPLERGLFAWDVLATSLWPPDDPFLAELRAALQPVRRFLPV